MFDRLRNLPIVLLDDGTSGPRGALVPQPGRHNLFVVNLDPLNRDEAADFVRKLLGPSRRPRLVDFIMRAQRRQPAVHQRARSR